MKKIKYLAIPFIVIAMLFTPTLAAQATEEDEVVIYEDDFDGARALHAPTDGFTGHAHFPNKANVKFDLVGQWDPGWHFAEVGNEFSNQVPALPDFSGMKECDRDPSGPLCVEFFPYFDANTQFGYQIHLFKGAAAISLNVAINPGRWRVCRAVYAMYGGVRHRDGIGCAHHPSHTQATLSEGEENLLQQVYP